MKAQEVHDRLGKVEPKAQIVISAESFYELLSNVDPDFDIRMDAGNGKRITLGNLAAACC